MATRGVQRGPTPPPPSEVAHLRAPGRARRNRGGESGAEAGDGAPKRRALGWKGSVRAAVWARRRSCLQPPARQSISSSVCLSSCLPLPNPRPSAQPLTHCGCQAALQPSTSPEPQPIAALHRGASGPRRAGRPGRCLRRRESRLGGRQPGARWGLVCWTGSPLALQGPAGLEGKAGAATA